MNTSKIIRGIASGRGYSVTSPIIKEDYGLVLKIEGVELPSTYQVDFSNDEHHGTSVTMIGNSDGVLIPSQFISSGKDVFAFLYHVGEDYGRTVYKFRIPNKLRPDRTDEEPTPEQASTIDQAIAALNEAVEQTAQDVIDADASAQSAKDDADRAEQAKDDAQTFAQRSAQSAQASADYSESASQSAQASAQSASASAQIKTDVESMVDDAQASADASERSASNAHTYATSAERSSVNASASETSAQGYASQAQTSAQTASSKASEASASAQTASTKASESAQSASQALTYKTDAESAKTASQAAQGLAEQAKADAITAKTGAESARDDAQNLVDGISGKVEQIDQNTADIASLEEDRYKPYVVDSASGSIASFPDGADDIPLKSLVVDIDPVQDLSHGNPSPDNICPISGWTEVGVEQRGKNLCDVDTYGMTLPYTTNGITFSKSANGNYHVSGTATGSAFFNLTFNSATDPFMPATPYVGKNLFVSIGNSKIEAYLGYFRQDGTFQQITNGNVIPSDAFGIRCYAVIREGTTIDDDFYPQIEFGSSATPYEPYTGRSITIDLGQTVYGAKLYPLEGKAVIDRAMVDLGTLRWTYNTTYAFFTTNSLTDRKKGVVNLISDLFKTEAGSWSGTPKANALWGNGSNTTVYVQYPITSVEDFMTLITGHQLCYELAEPIEIQLSANQINSLYGVNNIWSDSGDTEAEYRANTKLYIERLTQPEEDDMIADSAITSGKFFMVGNSLYRALANIASGATITVGTNAQRVSLSDALNLVNA